MFQKINLSERMDDFWVYPKLTKIKNQRLFSDDFFEFLKIKNDEAGRKHNIYIHIPFCSISCLFCPYYKIRKFTKESIKEYCESLKIEMLKYSQTPYFKSVKIDSLHFGGGDPLLLGEDNIVDLLSFIKEHFNFKVDKNVSLEATLMAIKSKEQLNKLYNAGVTRFSFGIQTFDEDVRKKMGMPSYTRFVEPKIEILKSSKVKHFCFDMMYNLPDQTNESMIRDLEKVTEIDPYHIDIYNMALFPNTTLEKRVNGNYYKIAPNNERNIEMFEMAHSWLLQHGFHQLTTSTYSKYQPKIDIGDQLYLSNSNVLGIGASSRGYISGMSYKNISDLNIYMSEVHNDNFPAELSYKATPNEDNDRRMVLFPITLAIKKDDIPDYSRYETRINSLLDQKLVTWERDVLCLTYKGIVYSGNISSIFMDEYNWDSYMKIFLNSMQKGLNPYNEDTMGIFDNSSEKTLLTAKDGKERK